MRFLGVSLNGERDSIAPEDSSATQDDHKRSIATDSFATETVATNSIARNSIATDSDFSLTDGTIISLSDALSESDDEHRARGFALVDADEIVSQSSSNSPFGSESQNISRREYPQLLNPVQPEFLDDCYPQDYVEYGKATPEETVEEIGEEITESLESYCTREYIEYETATPEEIAESLDSDCSQGYIEHGKATPEEIIEEYSEESEESLDSYCPREYTENGTATPEEMKEEYSEEISAAPIMRPYSATPLGSALNISLQSYTTLGAEDSSVDAPIRSGASLVESRATSDSSVKSPKEADDIDKQSEAGLAESLIRVSRSSSFVALPELLPANLLADSSMEPLLKRLEEAPSAHPIKRSIDIYEALERKGIPDDLATQALEEVESVLRKYATSVGVDAATFADFCQSHVSSRLESLCLRDVPLVERAPQLNADSAKHDLFEPIFEYENDKFSLLAKEIRKRARSLRPEACADPIVFLRKFVRNEDGTSNLKMYRRFSILVSRRKNESLRGFVMRMIRSTSFVSTKDQEDYINVVLPVSIVLGLRKHYQFIAADYRRFLTEAPEFQSTQSILCWFDDSSKRTRAHTRMFKHY